MNSREEEEDKAVITIPWIWELLSLTALQILPIKEEKGEECIGIGERG